MDHLLHHFESPVVDRSGNPHFVFLYGRRRADDTWEGWLAFERTHDGKRFGTSVETTQSSSSALVHWAAGLSDAYFEGAIDRAQRPRRAQQADEPPAPVVDGRSTTAERRERLAEIERQIMGAFRHFRRPLLLTTDIFEALPYAHADVVRALEDLEKQGRRVVRKTEGGSDWVFLTELGLQEIGLSSVPHLHGTETLAAPKQPKSR